MLPLVLSAVLATDVAVALLFLMVRRQAVQPLYVDAVSAEANDLLDDLRARAEEAADEIARQKAHLRQLLAEAQRGSNRPVAESRRDVVRLAGEGFSARAVASQTGLSLEEVRLLLATAGEASA